MSTIPEGESRWPPVHRGGALLAVRGLHKRYGDLRVLDDVSLTVAPGELVALVGDNGAGKSTLVKCIARAVSPDRGAVLVGGGELGAGQDDVAAAGIAVVWQDLALCDNLDAVANLFLGREPRAMLLAPAEMHAEARRMLTRLDIPIPDLTRPVATLSGGQRQAIAVARALAGDPRLLILDEPTASLGRTETAAVFRLVRRLRAAGTAVLLVTHQLEQVFDLADRIAVMRQGRIVADVSPREVHPDDVVAMQLGIEVDSTASRQLRRLGSLVEQLSEVEPAASLPLVVSALAAALGQESLCVHLVDDPAGPVDPADPADATGAPGPADGTDGPADGAGGPVLRRSAAVGLPAPLLEVTAELPLGPTGGPIGLAAARGLPVVSDDVRTDPAWRRFRQAAADAGVLSSWAAPISGASGVLGAISGFGDTTGRPRGDQLALIGLYANHAAASIERERLFAESRRRNRVLETIRTVLEALAGPEHVHAGTEGALAALTDVLGAEAAAVRVAGDAGPATRAAAGAGSGGHGNGAAAHGNGGNGGAGEARTAGRQMALLTATADTVLAGGDTARAGGEAGHVLAVPFDLPDGRAALAVLWRDAAATEGHGEVLQDVARSLSLGLEREGLEAAHREAQALRRSQRLQREFLSRLSHELRTPLTAIHGCVDTLLQPDVAWGAEETRRFLGTIGTESDRMRRLVADLLDASAIDAGIFRIHPDWCDLDLVLRASVACAAPGAEERVAVTVAPGLGPVWADHDKVEQVLVNLLENALRHSPAGAPVRVTAGPGPGGRGAEVVVSDAGDGVPDDMAANLFEPHVTGPGQSGTGLGLAIARGIARAHGGTLALRPPSPPAPPAPAGNGTRRRPGATFVLTLPPGPASPPALPESLELVDADD